MKISAGYGRIYVQGPGYKTALALPGAAENIKKSAIELSLTLDTLKALRRRTGLPSKDFARFCTPEVMQWANAAARVEKAVADLHRRIGEGFRIDFPWHDMRADSPAPDDAPERDVYTDNDGNLRYKYRAPYEHQQIMATFAASIEGCANTSQMGTGKTRATIEAFSHLLRQGHLDVVIVVCPKPVMKTWMDEVPLWTANTLTALKLDGPVRERGAYLRSWTGALHQPKVLLLNYDVLHSLKSDLRAFLAAHRVGIVPDEMHRIKNPDAKMTKAMLDLAQVATWRSGLTGTPVLQGVQDVWSQWYFVDLGVTFGSNYVQYRREHLNENPYTFRLEPKDGVLSLVGQKMRRRGIRFTKEECLDLPPKVYETLTVEMTRDQAAAYAQMEAELIALLEQTDEDDRVATAANQLAMILRLTQITSGFVPDEDGVIHRFRPNPKLDALEDLVREQINDQQILVWARYTEDIASICERLNDLHPVVVVGAGAISKITARGVAVPDRETAQDLFQAGQRRLLVANPGAGGVGLNLWKASLAIYYSQGYSLEHREQSEDRCHRGGSEIHNRVTYVDLTADRTIDLVVRSALLGKKSVAAAVVDLRQMLGVQ